MISIWRGKLLRSCSATHLTVGLLHSWTIRSFLKVKLSGVEINMFKKASSVGKMIQVLEQADSFLLRITLFVVFHSRERMLEEPGFHDHEPWEAREGERVR